MANPRGNGRNVAAPDENRPSWRPQDETARRRRSMSEEDERYMQRDRDRFGSHWEDRASPWERDEGYRREEEDHTYGSRNWGYPSHMEERATERDSDDRYAPPPRGTSRWGGYEGRYLGQSGQQMEWGNEGHMQRQQPDRHGGRGVQGEGGLYGQGGYNEGMYGQGGMQDRYGTRGYQGIRQPSHRGKGPVGYVRSDERIREMVCEALTEHDDIDATNIEVAVKAGDVVLSGTVEDRRQKRLAEDLVDQVTGVKDVQNQLRVAERKEK